MKYEDLTTEQTKALLDAIRDLPDGWRDLDDGELLARLTGGDPEGETGPVITDPDPEGETGPAIIEPTPQGVFQFSVPTSGWGAENYRVHWGDESAEIAQSSGNRATLADIESALESMHGIRDVEVTAPGPAEIIEGTVARPYRVSILDADPDTFRVTKGNGKNASVHRVVETDADPGAEPGASPADNSGPVVFEIMFFNPAYSRDAWAVENTIFGGMHFLIHYDNGETHHLDSPQSRNYGNLKSGLEAAFESLPNVASAEVVISSEGSGVIEEDEPLPISDKWRIELSIEGPGVVSGMDYQFEYSYPNPPDYGGREGGTLHGFINPIQQGAAQFSFDAVTPGALTPSTPAAAIDMGLDEADSATGAVATDPAAIWQMGIDGGFNGNLQLDYIGA